MVASELRIGNLVLVPEHLGLDVYTKPKIETEVFSISEGGINNEPFENITFGISQIAPIPLTKEYLLRFGFNGLDKGPLTVILTNGNVFYQRESMDNNPISNIKYVHQLQNLYFALTGEELSFT